MTISEPKHRRDIPSKTPTSDHHGSEAVPVVGVADEDGYEAIIRDLNTQIVDLKHQIGHLTTQVLAKAAEAEEANDLVKALRDSVTNHKLAILQQRRQQNSEAEQGRIAQSKEA